MTKEGKEGKYIYLVREGSLRVYKELNIKIPIHSYTVQRNFAITQIEKGSFFGEELLYPEYHGKYLYTIKVESHECKLLVFERNTNLRDFSTAFISKYLRKEFNLKVKARIENLELIENRNPEKLVVLKKNIDFIPDRIDDIEEEIHRSRIGSIYQIPINT